MRIRNELRLNEDVVQPFLDHLNKCDRFAVIASGTNSFEGWLKWELVAFCAAKIFKTNEIDPLRMGVESREPLSQVREQDKTEKLVDFWITTAPGAVSPPAYHLLELKAVFDNHNLDKVADNAGYDFWYLSTLAQRVRARTIGVLVLVQGWKEADLGRFKVRIENSMGLVRCTSATNVQLGRTPRWTALYYERNWRTAHRVHK